MNAHRSHTPRKAATVAAAAALAGLLAGCTGSPEATSLALPTSPSGSPGIVIPKSSDPAPAPRSSASGSATATASCATRTAAKLTEAQKVGQLFLVGLAQDYVGPVTTAALERYHFGSLLFGENTTEGVKAAAAATSHIQSLATSSVTGGVRFFISANQEGGEVQNLKGQGFTAMPTAVTQGGWSTGELRQQARQWGQELHAAGVNLNLAPVMDVVPAGTASSNAPIGQLDREFGSAPSVTGPHGAAFIAGMAAVGVATTAKHFPGLGRVAGNTDFTANVVDNVTTPDDPYFASYRDAISAGVPFVMVALATYTKIDSSELAVFSPAVMKLLRSQLGFGGVIISDDLGQAAAVQNIQAGQRAIAFLDAGGDMVTSQSLGPAEQMASAVLSRASSDPSFAAVVSAAVTRILAAKQQYGLLSC
ncbi:MAG: glycoside hydrolase family 3 N-terminal domain-containing protein [Trebonia sp.]